MKGLPHQSSLRLIIRGKLVGDHVQLSSYQSVDELCGLVVGMKYRQYIPGVVS